MTASAPADLFTLHGLLTVFGLLVYAVGSRTLQQRRHPSAAIGWLLMILLLPEIGVPLYLLFGTRKLPKVKARTALPAGALDERVVPAWAQRLTASMGLAPPLSYWDLRLHQDGGQARRALDELVDAARHSLDLSTVLLGRDEFGERLLDRLARRAREGVRVRLLVDGVGALMGGRRDFSEVQARGIEVVRFVPPLRWPVQWPPTGRTNLRNHRKVLIADGERLWSGGRNLAGEYFDGADGREPWSDLSFDLRGPLAGEAAAIFQADWAFARNDDATAAKAPAPPAQAAHQLGSALERGLSVGQMIPTGPDYADDTLHMLMLAAFHGARERILATTPYLVPDESLLMALVLAARRGVRVDLLIPARSNHRLADIARNRSIRELTAAGAKVWLSARMTHAKAVVVDDTLALCGSLNLDSRSLFLNYELMTAFYSRRDVQRFAQWVERELAAAAPCQPRAPGLVRSIGEGLVLWLGFQL
ncbi:MAG TPA: phospholipase D-like domain-containing protein [Burkholderiaceae bacterium]